MSFNYHARRVRDPDRPAWLRLSSMRACVRSYCRLTGASYARLLEYLQLDHSPDVPRDPPSYAFLQRKLDEVQRERNWFLDRLRAWERRRVRAKVRGGRQLSNAERAALTEMRGGVG